MQRSWCPYTGRDAYLCPGFTPQPLAAGTHPSVPCRDAFLAWHGDDLINVCRRSKTAAAHERITITPPRRSDGVARMLAALSAAHVAITHAEARSATSQTYILSVDRPTAALDALTSIGCTIESHEYCDCPQEVECQPLEGHWSEDPTAAPTRRTSPPRAPVVGARMRSDPVSSLLAGMTRAIASTAPHVPPYATLRTNPED